MEEMVGTAPEQATVFAFGPDEPAVDTQEEAVPVGDGEQATEPSETAANSEESPQSVSDSAPEEKEKEKSVGNAISRERDRVRKQAKAEYDAKLKNDPSYLLGKMMIDDMMSQEDGLSLDDAYKKATENFMAAVAKRDSISPSLAKKIYGTPQERKAESEEDRINRIVADVQNAKKPDGFNEEEAYSDDAFLTLLDEYPAEAAIRIYHAERQAANAPQDIAEKLRARQSIPQAIKPQQQTTPRIDWTKVSSEEFRKEKARREKLFR